MMVDAAEARGFEQGKKLFRKEQIRGVKEFVAELGMRLNLISTASQSLNVLPDTGSSDAQAGGEGGP
jgi:hypothetical protein